MFYFLEINFHLIQYEGKKDYYLKIWHHIIINSLLFYFVRLCLTLKPFVMLTIQSENKYRDENKRILIIV